MTVAEAAAELQVSTKTIKRRLSAGDLQGQLIAHRWIIDMPDEVVEGSEDSARSGREPEDKRDRTKGTEGTSSELLRLQAELEETRRDKEWLKGKVDDLTGMVDTLSNRTGEQASLIYHLQQRLLLAAPAPEEDSTDQAESHDKGLSEKPPQEAEPHRRSLWDKLLGRY
jgi:hypothetical protein